MNFISTFDELNKLYENTAKAKKHAKKADDAELVEGDDYWRDRPYNDQSQKDKGVIKPFQKPSGYQGSQASWENKCRQSADYNKRRNPWESLDTDNEEELTEGDDYWRDRPYNDQSQKDKGVIKPFQKPAGYQGSQASWQSKCEQSADFNKRRNPWESVEEPIKGDDLTEAAEDEEIEIVDEEIPEEEVATDEVVDEHVDEEEPRQVIIECSKCGALVIKPEADIVVDEESDLVNVKDKCDFCEEKEGFKIVGIVMPYETDEVDIVTEGLGDWYRKKFDRPASVTTQQMWEAEMEDLQLALEGELDDATRTKYEARLKELEQKFLQQRDWEGRHAKVEEACKDEELEEILDISVPVNVTANGNNVAVGGMN